MGGGAVNVCGWRRGVVEVSVSAHAEEYGIEN